MAAAQLAPLAISAAESVGSGALHMAENVVVATKEGSNPSEARGESCEEFEMETPGVIELRKDASGGAEYRELRLNGSSNAGQWIAMDTDDTARGGWRPAVNFLQMNFTPPLQNAIPESGSNYLAYAATDYRSAAEEDRLVTLTTNFGTSVGTFIWNGRQYEYAITHELPCFPPPSS